MRHKLVRDDERAVGSCHQSDSGDAIQQRLQQHHSRYPHLALSYADAGHAVDFPMPYEPLGQTDGEPTYGTTTIANDRARADAWPKILTFIRHPS